MTIRAAMTLMTALAASGAAQAAQSYLVEITGSPDAAFAGECTVERPDGEQRIALEGSPPLRREVTGIGLRCRLTQTSATGRMTLSVRRLDGAAVQTASVQGRGSTTAIAVR